MTSSNELFQPNNHSDWQVTWTRADASQDAEVREILRSHYGFEVQTPIHKVGAWEVRSNNFRVDLSQGSSKRTVLVKKNIAWRDQASIELVERVLGYLHEQGVLVPVVIPVTDGSAHVKSGDFFWQVFEFIPGNYFRGTQQELDEVATQIAKLHRALKTTPLFEEISKRTKVIKVWTPPDFVRHFENAATQGDLAHQALRTERTLIEACITVVTGHVEKMKQAQRQVVRNSLHPHDTLFVDGHLQAIIDFEEIGVNDLLRDIGNACHRFVRQFVVCQEKPWQESVSVGVNIFLNGYHKESPLTGEEVQLMPIFIKDELLRKLHSSLVKMEVPETQKKYESEVLKFIHLLEEADEVGKEIQNFVPLMKLNLSK